MLYALLLLSAMPVDQSTVSVVIEGKQCSTVTTSSDAVPPSAQYFDDRTKAMNLTLMVGMDPEEIRGTMTVRLKTTPAVGETTSGTVEYGRITKKHGEVAYTAKAVKVLISQFETHAVDGMPAKQGTVSGTFEGELVAKKGKKRLPLTGKFEKVTVYVISGDL
jgi:hypothetical protein